MREIKFRGYCDIDKKWHYGFYVKVGILHQIHHLNKDGSVYIVNVDPKSVGQFTGVTLPCGAELYEGDIVEMFGVKSKVYVDEFFAFTEFDGEEYYNVTEYTHDKKIVGNIYENAEMLDSFVLEAK